MTWFSVLQGSGIPLAEPHVHPRTRVDGWQDMSGVTSLSRYEQSRGCNARDCAVHPTALNVSRLTCRCTEQASDQCLNRD